MLWSPFDILKIFTASLPLRYLDLSHNYLRKLMDKMLSTIQNTLIELRLQSNLLGDTLNPIFSTSEFRGLKYLNLLDLSSNGIKAIEEGILDGCDKLQGISQYPFDHVLTGHPVYLLHIR
ncbi:hypothetical protein YQE_04692, partial [Dendroctonus ponderosae]